MIQNAPKIEIRSEGDCGKKLSKIYECTLKDMVDKIENNGFYNVSKKTSPNYNMAKSRITSYGSFYGQAWTRDVGRAIIELSHLGISKVKTTCLWFANHFDAYPERWCRVIYPNGKGGNEPWVPCSNGDYENDGHGLILLGMFHTWKYLGDERWVKGIMKGYETGLNWVEYWSDNSRFHHLLYTISECSEHVRGAYDIYSNTICAEALNCASRMLEITPIEIKELSPARLRKYCLRLKRNITKYLVDSKKDYWVLGKFEDGKILDYKRMTWLSFDKLEPSQLSGWQMAPLTISPDSYSYIPLLTYKKLKGIKLCINTYKKYCKFNKQYMKKTKLKHFAFYGAFPRDPSKSKQGTFIDISYDHAPLTQSALLLDEMQVAEDGIKTIVDGCENSYLPSEWRYIVPQGLVMRRDKVTGVGDIGNLINEGEVMKVLRIMVGVDDNQDTLNLVPRFPLGWQIKIGDYPIAILKENKIQRTKISYKLVNTRRRITFSAKLDQNVGEIFLRLGPIPEKASKIEFTPSGKVIESGDSKWVEFNPFRGTKIEADIRYT